MATKEQLDDFYQFAIERVNNGGAELSIDELYLVWRTRRPTGEELSESIAAVREAYADFRAGDRGEPAREALREVCREFGLVIEQ